MADLQRAAADAIIQALQGANCRGYDFFRVVRMIQAARPDLPLIGTSKTPDDDLIRFGQRPSLGFPPTTLDELTLDKIAKLYVNFFGLFGPNGPLPLHLTNYAIRRQLGQRGDDTGESRATAPTTVTDGPSAPVAGYKDHALADFFDVFHHRFISLFFRAWAVCQPTVDWDRDNHQRFLFFLGAFSGESIADPDDDSFGDGDAIPLRAKVYYSGRLSCPCRNAEGLEAILEDYFKIPTRIQEFVGRWFNLPPEDWCELGRSRAAGLIGQNVIVGSRTWAANLSFRVRMGPMPFTDYCRLLPPETGFARLRSWILNYCGAELLWELQLVLLAAEVPDTRLGRAGKLGWTTWLKTGPFVRDAADLVLAPPEHFSLPG